MLIMYVIFTTAIIATILYGSIMTNLISIELYEIIYHIYYIIIHSRKKSKFKTSLKLTQPVLSVTQ